MVAPGDPERAADLAFTTVKLGQTSFPELASAIGKVAISASGLQITQEELNAVFATMTGVTGSASEVATQFKGALTGLKKPSEEMWAALDKIGFSSGEAAIETLGFQGTLTALTGAVGGSESEMTKLFGSTESWDLIAGLAGVQAEKFTSNLDQMEGATGTLSEALKEQSQGINKSGADFAKLRQAFVVTAQRLGDELVPENLRTALNDLSGMSMAKAQLSKSTEGKQDRFNQANSVRGGVVVAYAEKTYRPASAIRESRTACEKNGPRRMFAAQ